MLCQTYTRALSHEVVRNPLLSPNQLQARMRTVEHMIETLDRSFTTFSRLPAMTQKFRIHLCICLSGTESLVFSRDFFFCALLR